MTSLVAVGRQVTHEVQRRRGRAWKDGEGWWPARVRSVWFASLAVVSWVMYVGCSGKGECCGVQSDWTGMIIWGFLHLLI